MTASTASGRMPSPTCQTAAAVGGSPSGQRLVITVPSENSTAEPSAKASPGALSSPTAMPWPSTRKARPDIASSSPATRARPGRSPRIAQAISAAQTRKV